MINLIMAVMLSGSVSAAPSPTAPVRPSLIKPHAAAQTMATSSVLSAADRRIVKRITAYILKTQKSAKPYAHRLAERIMIEARLNRIDVATFVAIAWIESRFWWKVHGTSNEYGVWQVWPYGSAVRQEWDRLRKAGQIGTFPDRPWRLLSYPMRQKILQNVNTGTALAARILRQLLAWCKTRHKAYPAQAGGSMRHLTWIDRYAHYNSGYKWPKQAYLRQLRDRTLKVQAALAGP